MADSVTPSPAPRGELTPEIRAAIDQFGVAVMAYARGSYEDRDRQNADLNEADANLKFAILSALSGPPSGQESRDTVLLDWLEENAGEYGLSVSGICTWGVDRPKRRSSPKTHTNLGNGADLREAIEDAISAEIVDEAGEGGFDTEERP